MGKIKAVLFDMDGVLIDAKEWHYEALNRALDEYGYTITRQEHETTYDGLPTKVKLKRLTDEKGLPEELHDIINQKKQEYTVEIAKQLCKPRPNHEDALSRLKQDGYRMAVCSNSIKSTIELMIGNANLIQYFEFMLSNQDVTKSKPDPEIYQTAIKRMGLQPDECLICEDNKNGIAAAIASGAYLFKVGTVDDVTYDNIKSRIEEIERTGK